jgi:hypothetical protein
MSNDSNAMSNDCNVLTPDQRPLKRFAFRVPQTVREDCVYTVTGKNAGHARQRLRRHGSYQRSEFTDVVETDYASAELLDEIPAPDTGPSATSDDSPDSIGGVPMALLREIDLFSAVDEYIESRLDQAYRDRRVGAENPAGVERLERLRDMLASV